MRHQSLRVEGRRRARAVGSFGRKSGRLAPGLAPEAWWLATTSRWRTTGALHTGPTKPVLRSRVREHLKKPSRVTRKTLSGVDCPKRP
ncbi:hypothetical protein X805_21450 [Sphaerotilus natans subsp. natans DSM 6575]|uniref:Uncharacterized protein n=1 Tax=Sphaerotilus natans subsp. natans DSM 6575 TaxID=1286631 RepID=A0A059KL77_9BURK|nr:hypothetical protein X805_21450 [Sphaerotilus natans subsp. natans DSM 6575]